MAATQYFNEKKKKKKEVFVTFYFIRCTCAALLFCSIVVWRKLNNQNMRGILEGEEKLSICCCLLERAAYIFHFTFNEFTMSALYQNPTGAEEKAKCASSLSTDKWCCCAPLSDIFHHLTTDAQKCDKNIGTGNNFRLILFLYDNNKNSERVIIMFTPPPIN